MFLLCFLIKTTLFHRHSPILVEGGGCMALRQRYVQCLTRLLDIRGLQQHPLSGLEHPLVGTYGAQGKFSETGCEGRDVQRGS
jgi:hypothetical protein